MYVLRLNDIIKNLNKIKLALNADNKLFYFRKLMSYILKMFHN